MDVELVCEPEPSTVAQTSPTSLAWESFIAWTVIFANVENEVLAAAWDSDNCIRDIGINRIKAVAQLLKVSFITAQPQ